MHSQFAGEVIGQGICYRKQHVGASGGAMERPDISNKCFTALENQP
jgi:hypothetical protein